MWKRGNIGPRAEASLGRDLALLLWALLMTVNFPKGGRGVAKRLGKSAQKQGWGSTGSCGGLAEVEERRQPVFPFQSQTLINYWLSHKLLVNKHGRNPNQSRALLTSIPLYCTYIPSRWSPSVLLPLKVAEHSPSTSWSVLTGPYVSSLRIILSSQNSLFLIAPFRILKPCPWTPHYPSQSAIWFAMFKFGIVSLFLFLFLKILSSAP